MIIITGASSGIGEAFAKQLSNEKKDILLVARNEAALLTLKSNLSNANTAKTQIEILKLDLSTINAHLLLLTFIEQKKLKIKGLINCAGIGQQGYFDNQALALQTQIIHVNITALMQLSHAVIPLLKQQDQETFIINVASTAAFQAGPKMAVYYASKAFVLSFSEALHEELLDTNIKVSCLCPGFTQSNFFKNSKMSADKTFASGVMSPQRVVQVALKNKHKAVVIPGFRNQVGALFSKLLARKTTRKLAGKFQG